MLKKLSSFIQQFDSTCTYVKQMSWNPKTYLRSHRIGEDHLDCPTNGYVQIDSTYFPIFSEEDKILSVCAKNSIWEVGAFVKHETSNWLLLSVLLPPICNRSPPKINICRWINTFQYSMKREIFRTSAK